MVKTTYLNHILEPGQVFSGRFIPVWESFELLRYCDYCKGKKDAEYYTTQV